MIVKDDEFKVHKKCAESWNSALRILFNGTRGINGLPPYIFKESRLLKDR